MDDEQRGEGDAFPELNEAQPGRVSKGGGNKLSAKYGDLMNKMGGGAAKSPKGKKGGKQKEESKEEENMETAEEEEKRLKQLRGKMTEEEALENVSGSALVGIIDRDAVQSGKGNYSEEALREQALELQRNDKEFVYQQRKKKLEVRYKELSAAKKEKIAGYKVESDKMELMDEQIRTVQVKILIS